MKNYYTILFFVMALCCGISSQAQTSLSKETASLSGEILELSIYPNPVSNGKIYITTKKNTSKKIEIYDVLGKKIISASLLGKELNISKLTEGIYILKIREGENSATRKLVVR